MLSDLTLEQIFAERLTDTPCVYLNKEREVWVATEMCVQYLESTIDSIVVRDDDLKPIGIVGGYDLLDSIRRNPSRDFQYKTNIEQIMFKDLLIVDKDTKLRDLIERWKVSRRAFAITPNKFRGYSPLSARKMLEVGTKCKTDISVSSIPKKKIITFHPDDSLDKIINLMFENKTRKLLLEYSNQFISDRLILEAISNTLKFQPSIENLFDIPVNQIDLKEVTVIKEDLKLDKLCSLMYEMDHPYVYYKDIAVSPWDVCLILMSESLTTPLESPKHDVVICPHCGKDVILG